MRRLIKKQIALFSIIILLMIALIVSSSYALFKSSEEVTAFDLTTNNFNVTYASNSAALSGNIYAMTNEEGLSTPGYKVTISLANGAYGAKYYIDVFNNPPANFDGELIDPSYIMVAIDTAVFRLSQCNTEVIDGITYYKLGASIISPGGTIPHTLRVWLDNNTPSTEADKFIYLETKITSEAITPQSYLMDEQLCTLIDNTYGNHLEIGAKYSCNLGDGYDRTFYLLGIDSETGFVKLIFEKNVSDLIGSNPTMNYDDAIAFFNEGHAGYQVKQAWNKAINVDLPDINDIMAASLAMNPKEGFSVDFNTQSGTWWCLGSHEKDEPSGPTFCPTSEAQQRVAWLFNYTRDCVSRGCVSEYPASGGDYPYGYWTKNIVATDDTRAWRVTRYGGLASSAMSDTSYGVRPVVTVYPTNLTQ